MDLPTREPIYRRLAPQWEEQDAFSSWRRILCYMNRPGVSKNVKARHNRRTRRQVRQQLNKERP